MRPLEADEPTTIGPYRLLGLLGAGGMGRVYLGRSEGGRTVAVKVVHPHFARDEEFRARFRREVDAARRVGGDWTAPVLAADPEAAVPWVATGYAAGPSLTEAVRESGPLPAHSVRVLGAGLAEALAHVHGLGLVHRDVKPSNVLLTLDGPRLIDFGIARATDGTASLTSTGVSIGSPGHMAPEQALGKGVTGAADVFSLGAVLVHAATGESPFPGDSSAALLYKVVHEEPELGALAGDLRDLAAACLAKNPAERPAPREVARRLAPGGVAPLVAAGWLPAPVVERVSRSVVRLLDLDTAPAAAAADAPSGPVPFTSPSAPAAGTFGPPDPAYGASPDPSYAAPPAAASAPEGPNRRGRRVSCTVALAVAGALAAVTVGSVFMLDLLPGNGDERAGSDGQPSAATSAPRPSDAAGTGGVPEPYLGKWSGEADAKGGTIPLGTFEVTLQQTKPGSRLGKVVQRDLIGNTCTDVLTLKSATSERLVATAKGAPTNGTQCAQTPHTVYLTPSAKHLVYTSKDPEAGNPRARLSRVR